MVGPKIALFRKVRDSQFLINLFCSKIYEELLP